MCKQNNDYYLFEYISKRATNKIIVYLSVVYVHSYTNTGFIIFDISMVNFYLKAKMVYQSIMVHIVV